ncbi:ComEA family DNA-binding protein [Neptuniibacter halophilus]|uniref:ComEA family DNA-binding protein n=1 Tax=Neptuniibacter halophilus TaxID=651666 RepID=UPI0025746EC1|nr:helix-hairpin-helix domain-containing protein [Neptuniibacter halophilus]
MKVLNLRAFLLALICLFSLPALAEPIDLNTATAQQLSAGLDGVGPAKAKAIIDYRETNGPFTSVDQLTEVEGIGQATLKKNLDRLTLTPAAKNSTE